MKHNKKHLTSQWFDTECLDKEVTFSCGLIQQEMLCSTRGKDLWYLKLILSNSISPLAGQPAGGLVSVSLGASGSRLQYSKMRSTDVIWKIRNNNRTVTKKTTFFTIEDFGSLRERVISLLPVVTIAAASSDEPVSLKWDKTKNEDTPIFQLTKFSTSALCLTHCWNTPDILMA